MAAMAEEFADAQKEDPSRMLELPNKCSIQPTTGTCGPKGSPETPCTTSTDNSSAHRAEADPKDLPRLLKLGGGAQDAKLGPCSPGSTVASERDVEGGTPHEAKALSLLCGAHQIPHPAKVSYGGEDAFFASEAGSAVGVADGVSEWGWRFGMNPRDFSSQLMRGAQAAVEAVRTDGSASAKERAARALEAGHAGVDSFGAATAIVAVLDPSNMQLGVANLGDSGLRQFRRAPESSAVHVVAKTEEQQHAFNQPFQLSRIPAPADFPRLLAEGKTTLVEAVRKCKEIKLDQPSDACLYGFPVEEGDLIMLASDGVFDNLHDAELCDIVSKTLSEEGAEKSEGRDMVDPGALATAIAKSAFGRSQDRSADTPFGQKVKQAGYKSPGGMPDDITVVVAWVTNRLGANRG